MQLFIDLDGVLADFDAHHEAIFGRTPKRALPNDNPNVYDVDWKAIRAVGDFYAEMPPMADHRVLWDHVKRHDPIILTGIPDVGQVPDAAANKRAWVDRVLDTYVRVITCPSSEKWRYARPGDIIVDDWEKYQHRWIDAGGVWITHVTAMRSVEDLIGYGVT